MKKKTEKSNVVQSSLIVILSTVYVVFSISNLLHDLRVDTPTNSNASIHAFSLNSGDTKPDTMPPER